MLVCEQVWLLSGLALYRFTTRAVITTCHVQR
jgi:hypothetical protein